jgi:predicted AAA+ superfamily ATPase
MFRRSLRLPPAPEQSFFLWGPRQTGKSSLLRASYPAATWIDLLKSDEFARYSGRPALLREELLAAPPTRPVVIDEVQKVPSLLDEVHWLIENRGVVFALCGSSARRVRRGGANLLGGRALRHELFGLVSAEVGDAFDIVRAVNHGGLPRHYLSDAPARLLQSYVGDYLKDEIAAEGLVRNLPAFADFLGAAALSDAELVNFVNIARECGVSAPTVRAYFQILVDTLLGRFVAAHVKRPKRRVIQAPKFYFSDVGVVNHLARRGRLEPGGELFGKALESWICHELTAYLSYREIGAELRYWRLASGIEVDFVTDDLRLAVEVKATARPADAHLKGLRALRTDQGSVQHRVPACLEKRARRTEDGIDILPVTDFLRRLWAGELIGA